MIAEEEKMMYVMKATRTHKISQHACNTHSLLRMCYVNLRGIKIIIICSPMYFCLSVCLSVRVPIKGFFLSKVRAVWVQWGRARSVVKRDIHVSTRNLWRLNISNGKVVSCRILRKVGMAHRSKGLSCTLITAGSILGRDNLWKTLVDKKQEVPTMLI